MLLSYKVHYHYTWWNKSWRERYTWITRAANGWTNSNTEGCGEAMSYFKEWGQKINNGLKFDDMMEVSAELKKDWNVSMCVCMSVWRPLYVGTSWSPSSNLGVLLNKPHNMGKRLKCAYQCMYVCLKPPVKYVHLCTKPQGSLQNPLCIEASWSHLCVGASLSP